MKMRAFLLGISFMIIGFYSWPTTNTPTVNTLTLKKRAVINDHLVKMKDIASMDNTLRSRIGNLVVAISPDLGKTSVIQKQEIYEKLIGNGVQPLDLKGPANVTVLRQGIVVKPTFFQEMIHEYIVNHSRWKNGVEVTVITSKSIAVPESGIHWQLIPANGQDFFGNILFKVKAFSDKNNEEIYSNWIVAKLKITERIPISNREIHKNEIISPGDIRWEKRELTAFTKGAILNEQDIVGQKTGRIIRPNTVITESLMGKRVLVRRGGIAVLIARLNGIKATSTVKVLSDGSLGDVVRAMNIRSKRVISAVVAGKNTLEVMVQ